MTSGKRASEDLGQVVSRDSVEVKSAAKPEKEDAITEKEGTDAASRKPSSRKRRKKKSAAAAGATEGEEAIPSSSRRFILFVGIIRQILIQCSCYSGNLPFSITKEKLQELFGKWRMNSWKQEGY